MVKDDGSVVPSGDRRSQLIGGCGASGENGSGGRSAALAELGQYNGSRVGTAPAN